MEPCLSFSARGAFPILAYSRNYYRNAYGEYEEGCVRLSLTEKDDRLEEEMERVERAF